MSEVAGVAVLVVGVVVALLIVLLARREARALHRRAEGEVAAARRMAQDLLDQARAERQRTDDELSGREERLAAREHRLAAAAERLDEDRVAIDDARRQLDVDLAAARRETEERRAALDAEERERRSAWTVAEEARRLELERVAGLTAEQARAELVAEVTDGARREALGTVRRIEEEARRDGEAIARRIVADAIQRIATEQTADSVVSVVHLPGDEMKGRIIGREGRNIRAFEAVTGVNLVIDDAPGAVLLSCFDPVRRERARLALEALVADGRIHPGRIEAAVEAAAAELDHVVDRAGADAVERAGVTGLHPELVRLLGTLRFRTSYGQNVLEHLVESAHIAGAMAAELGIDVPLVKRCAFLHDIGKALTHEVEGTHAAIGADLARRYGESEDVVHAIAAHHDEVPPQTVEAVLTQAADACSGGRPGARREALESYVERLHRLEEIAAAHAGVEKVYAMSAGRDVRVMVRPEDVDDVGAELMARAIAKQVSEELTYPGQIRITVVRESRATATAS
ncbi:MAG: ribonuclease Y [Actinomycetota bacterium]